MAALRNQPFRFPRLSSASNSGTKGQFDDFSRRSSGGNISAMSEHSVSQFIHLLRDGDPRAAAPIWNHFYSRLVTLANKQLKSCVRRVIEGEDVAQSVFDSCFRAMREGRVPDLKNRDNLWALLVTITERKAANVNRKLATLAKVERKIGMVRNQWSLAQDESGESDGLQNH
jgi:DNA-directed RNA polymerase specialized sigma24 family protein